MITKTQGKLYTELHDRLNDVYLQKQNEKKTITDFYAGFKIFYLSIKTKHYEIEKIRAEHPSLYLAHEMEHTKTLALIKGIFTYTNRLAEHMALSLKTDEGISKLMQDIINHQKQFKSNILSQKQIDQVLQSIEQRIETLKTQVETLVSGYDILYRQNEDNKAIYYKDNN